MDSKEDIHSKKTCTESGKGTHTVVKKTYTERREWTHREERREEGTHAERG